MLKFKRLFQLFFGWLRMFSPSRGEHVGNCFLRNLFSFFNWMKCTIVSGFCTLKSIVFKQNRYQNIEKQKSQDLEAQWGLNNSTDDGREMGEVRYRNTATKQDHFEDSNGTQSPTKEQQEQFVTPFFDQNNHSNKLQNGLSLENRGHHQKFEVPKEAEQDVPPAPLTDPEPTPPQPLQQREIDTKLTRKARTNLNNFAFKLNQILYHDKNFVYSPFSIFIALGLVLEGTQKNTQKQILEMLDMHEMLDENSSLQFIRESYLHFLSYVLFQSKKSFKLFSANRFYGNNDVKFSPEYKKILQKYYFSDSVSADFSNQPENERLKINAWIQKITQDQIKDLLPVSSITPLSVSVLVNAMYFEGSWDEVFEKEKNEMRDFTLKDGSVKKVEMMVQKFKEYSVSTDFEDVEGQIKCIAIKMPYDRRTASLHIVLPLYEEEDLEYEPGAPQKGKKSQIEKLLEDLNEETLQHVCFYGDDEFVDLYIPKFSLEFNTTLSDPLKKLGMIDAFDPSAANFSGMVQNNSDNNIFISEGYHKTKITVDETGTVAGTATAFGTMKGIPPQPRQFEVNRPFLFMVVHQPSKSILFSGVVEDPSQT